MRLWLPVLVAVLAAACGGSSPTQPQPNPNPVPNPQPPTWTIKGTVTTTLTGEPVAGASLTFGTQTITADSAGRWVLTGTGTPSGVYGVEVSAAGYLTRKTGITAENGRDVTIDLIRDAGDFSLAFYRQIARNDFDQPGQLQWTRRWTVAPKFYINTFNPRTNSDISQAEITAIASAIRDILPQATGGTFVNPVIETGSGSRTSTGFIEIRITYDPNGDEFGDYCGRATVATDPGLIKINFAQCTSVCGAIGTLGPVASHEVGHSMGLYHTAGPGVMSLSWLSTCGGTSMSTQERHHAKLLYSRPVGNADMDWDQPSTPLLKALLAKPAPVVQCFRR
jgi:hypothetical protein